jgi:hypothetical protein
LKEYVKSVMRVHATPGWEVAQDEEGSLKSQVGKVGGFPARLGALRMLHLTLQFHFHLPWLGEQRKQHLTPERAALGLVEVL